MLMDVSVAHRRIRDRNTIIERGEHKQLLLLQHSKIALIRQEEQDRLLGLMEIQTRIGPILTRIRITIGATRTQTVRTVRRPEAVPGMMVDPEAAEARQEIRVAVPVDRIHAQAAADNFITNKLGDPRR